MLITLRSRQSVFFDHTSFVHFINSAFQISVFSIKSERSGEVRNPSVGKRLQIVSAHGQDSLEFSKSTVFELVNHRMSSVFCDFIKIIRNREIDCAIDIEVMNLKTQKFFCLGLTMRWRKISVRMISLLMTPLGDTIYHKKIYVVLNQILYTFRRF